MRILMPFLNFFKPNLTVGEVTQRTYRIMVEKLKAKEFLLPNRLRVLCADDSDERIRQGFMEYRVVAVAQIGAKNWLIGRGESVGDYPSYGFDSDIAVLPITIPHDKITAEILYEGDCFFRGFFFSSLILGLSDRRGGGAMIKVLPAEEDPYLRSFFQSMKIPKPVTENEISEFILLRKPWDKIRYRTNFPNYLADKCIVALSSS